MPRLTRRFGERSARLILTALLAVAILVPACSEPTRHRVLSFFFDGVPKPGETPQKGYGPSASATTRSSPRRQTEGASVVLVSVHPPYKNNRCDGCHNAGSGLLFRTARQGLCRKCHPNVPGQVRFVHGPVAVNDCLYCHDPHASAHPKLLLEDPATVCFRCHKRTDLTTGPHHSTLEKKTCLGCHNAHGGEDKYFLKNEASVERNQ